GELDAANPAARDLIINNDTNTEHDFAIDPTAGSSRTFYVASLDGQMVKLKQMVEHGSPSEIGSFYVGNDVRAPFIEFDANSSPKWIYLSLTRGTEAGGFRSAIQRINANDLSSSTIAGSLSATATFLGTTDDASNPLSGRIAEVKGLALSTNGDKLYIAEQSQEATDTSLGFGRFGRVRQLDLAP
ncbi:MAG: hypothetical protein VKP62_01255, partial [Candidatus Sericytochromatia bacterium]|nr:hypothetical protein [Candidatus Sericytochromatia bacterium]